jgi:hypothetical protein
MKKWLRDLENSMAAAAFAEAGELETARETMKGRRRILLALRGEESDINALKYALNTCKRVGADLEILHVTKIPKDLLRHIRSELKKERIDHFFISKSGSLEENIKKHSGMNENILFVVIEVSEGVDMSSKKSEKIIKNTWRNLKCPLVVVSQGNTAFAS